MTTRRLKRLAAATAVAGLVTVLVPSAAGAVKKQTVSPVVMGADNTITGSSGRTVVTIPQGGAGYDAKTGDNPYFRFSGGGRFVGVLLAEVGPDLNASGVSFFAGRYGFCGSPGCTPAEATQFLTVRGTNGESVLPPGNYNLYLVAETPATVRLHFDGLSGKTNIDPQRPLGVDVTEPGSEISMPENVAYSYGKSYDFKGEHGLVFNVLSITGDAWAAGRYGNCIYRGDPPLPPQLAHNAPGCPGGLSLAEVDVTTRPSEFRIDSYSTTLFDPGKWTMSSFYEAGGLIDGSDALSVAVDLPPT